MDNKKFPDFRDKIRGCLVGTMIGSAMQPPGSQKCTERMTRAVAESLIAYPVFNLHDQAKKFVTAFEESPEGYGKTTAKSAKELGLFFSTNGEKGRCPEQAPKQRKMKDKTSKNDIAIKIAPLAILYGCGEGDDIEPFLSFALELSRMTDPDPDAFLSAVAVGAIIASSLEKYPIRGLLFEKAVQRCDYATVIAAMRTKHLSHLQSSFEPPAAVSIFFYERKNIWGGIVAAQHLKNEPESVPLYMSMIGAVVGFSNIPPALLHVADPQTVQYAIHLADKLAKYAIR